MQTMVTATGNLVEPLGAGQLGCDLTRLKQIIDDLEDCGGEYQLSDVITLFQRAQCNTSVAGFFREQIEYNRQNRQFGTARNYERTLNSLQNFLQGEDISFAMITETLMMEYERWLVEKGVTRNSCSFYIRNLRSVYNKAVRRNLTVQAHPFCSVYTGTDRTRKRAVDEKVIMRLVEMDLRHSRALALARDIFVFSYCTRGMAFVDIAFLKKTDIANGMITYVRRKTGQQLCVRVEPCMEKIIRRYEKDTLQSPYVFPIITMTEPAAAYKQYQISLSYHNRKLKRLARALGDNLLLSSYTARHTWATTAKKHNVPIAVISEGMGHTSEKTTQIYLASLENSVIDEANKGIVGSLNSVL